MATEVWGKRGASAQTRVSGLFFFSSMMAPFTVAASYENCSPVPSKVSPPLYVLSAAVQGRHIMCLKVAWQAVMLMEGERVGRQSTLLLQAGAAGITQTAWA